MKITMKTAIMSLIILLAAACGQPDWIAVDKTMDPECIATIHSAAAAWEQRDHYLDVVEVSHRDAGKYIPGAISMRFNPEHPDCVSDPDLGGWTAPRWARRNQKTVMLCDCGWAVAAHEIGHGLDYGHSPDPNNVMHAVTNPDRTDYAF